MNEISGAEFDLRTYFSTSRDLYCEFDRNGTFLHINEAWESCLGYTRSELIGEKFVRFLHPDDLKRSEAAFDDRATDKAGFRNRYRHRLGHFVTVEWSGHFNRTESRIHANARDITDEQRQATILLHVASIQDAYMRHGTDKRRLFDHILAETLRATESEFGFIGEIHQGGPRRANL